MKWYSRSIYMPSSVPIERGGAEKGIMNASLIRTAVLCIWQTQWFWLRLVWCARCQCTTEGVLPVTSLLPLPAYIISSPSKSAEWESICHTGGHTHTQEYTLLERQREGEKMIEKGEKEWQLRWKDDTERRGSDYSRGMIAELGKKFTWKER